LNPDPEQARTVDVALVERIGSIADPLLRNLRITQCYHELALALAVRTPGLANWCSFATWASKQAGQTIRGEDLERMIENRFEHSPMLDELVRAVVERARALGATPQALEIRRALRELADPAAIAARASEAVALGNLKVFAEIAREFARFLDERSADARHDEASIARFCAGLRAGDPPQGQACLQRAFARSYRAWFEPDARVRSEQMLLANLEVGLHEQTRLQPEILAALNAPVLDAEALRSRLAALLFPRQARRLQRARGLLRRTLGGPTPLDRALGELVERVRTELRQAITEHLMSLALPRGVVVSLGSDLRAAFPASLSQLADPELRSFLARVDPTPDSLLASGASDWGDLSERMHLIAELFRCWHESDALLDAPFSAEQRIAIRAGQRPSGTL